MYASQRLQSGKKKSQYHGTPLNKTAVQELMQDPGNLRNTMLPGPGRVCNEHLKYTVVLFNEYFYTNALPVQQRSAILVSLSEKTTQPRHHHNGE